MWTEKLKRSTTTDGKPPREGYEEAGAPAPINKKTGQHEAYYILTPEERAKGFVRPVRTAYKHVGRKKCGKLAPWCEKQNDTSATDTEKWYCTALPGHSWQCTTFEPEAAKDRQNGCGQTTTMGLAIAETYAREPQYYGSTFCATCRAHFPVGEFGEFDWSGEEGVKVGT